jgi:hypothetical protein
MIQPNSKVLYWDEQTKKEWETSTVYFVKNPLILEDDFFSFVSSFNETYYEGFDILTDDDIDICLYLTNKRGKTEDFNFIMVALKSDGYLSLDSYQRQHCEIQGYKLNNILFYFNQLLFIFLSEKTTFLNSEKNPLGYDLEIDLE